MVKELVIKRLPYWVLPGSRKEDITVTKERGIQLENVCDWLSEDSGIIVNEADIQNTVVSWMQDKMSIINGLIHANKNLCAQWKGSDECLLAQTTNEKAVRKHGLVQNAWSTHARPETAVHVIGSAVGVSINTEVWPTKSNAVAAEFMPITANRQTNSSRCEHFIAGMTGISGGHPASRGAILIENGQGNKVPVGGGCF